ncbi:uncharacterized protein PG986_014155 [Apiospora aurea]|uniref:Uncharacterized protein n=1 Tax=Apiospora aurea TaxID=335848 RepID=A0ABR1PSG9_9PEZI
MSAIVSVLPGYTFIIATLELIHPPSSTVGVARLFNAAVEVVLLGYGIQLASLLWQTINSDPHSAACLRSVYIHPKFKLLLAPLILILTCVRGGSRLRQIPVQIILASAAVVVQRIIHIHTDPQLAMLAGAFTLGVLGNVYALVWNQFAFTVMVIGVQLLVPGGMTLEGELVEEMFRLVVPLMMGLLLSALVFSWRQRRGAFLY